MGLIKKILFGKRDAEIKQLKASLKAARKQNNYLCETVSDLIDTRTSVRLELEGTQTILSHKTKQVELFKKWYQEERAKVLALVMRPKGPSATEIRKKVKYDMQEAHKITKVGNGVVFGKLTPEQAKKILVDEDPGNKE